MNRDELTNAIDHTVLGPETTVDDVQQVLDEAADYGMNACIPPCYVAEAREYAPDDLTIATVVGFPHGQHAPGIKRDEAVAAWEDGADEIDAVLNVGRLHAGDHEAVRSEIAAIADAVPIPVKVILETALLSDEEIRTASGLAADAGADFVKTSTGFADGGATVGAVEIMAEYLPVKASGGIGDWATAKAMFDAGADRLGASSGVAIVEDYEERVPDR